MELAVKVMRKSVAEGREDRKTSPLVGAVLIMPDGSVETAIGASCAKATTRNIR